MQNLLPSKLLLGEIWGAVIGSGGETDWLRGGGCLGLFTDFTATLIEIIIANTMIMNKSGLSKIRLNDRGRTG